MESRQVSARSGPAERANGPAYEWPVSPGTPAREVWYLLVTSRERSLVLWVRYTLVSTTDGDQEARLWAAVTDRNRRLTQSVRTVTVDPATARIETDPFQFVLSEHGSIETTGATGSVPADPELAWDLTYTPDGAPFTPLRSKRLTSLAVALLGTGRHWSGNQSVRATGQLTVDSETVTFSDAPTHQGHTVGRNAAPQWQWVHCNSFDDENVVIETLRTRGKTSICLRVGKQRYRLNRLHHVVGPLANESTAVSPGRWQFRGRGDGVELHASVEADSDHWRLASYRTPDGSLRYVAHCSLSRIELSYRERGQREWHHVESHRARAEWADKEPPVPGSYPPFASKDSAYIEK